MQACTTHVQYQLPNDHTRIRDFLYALESQYLPLLSAMVNIEEDNGIAGKHNDFDLAVAYILPKDPVLKQQSNENNKRSQAHISDTNATGFGSKNGISTSGAHLLWHAKLEYKKFIKDQKEELWKCHKELWNK